MQIVYHFRNCIMLNCFGWFSGLISSLIIETEQNQSINHLHLQYLITKIMIVYLLIYVTLPLFHHSRTIMYLIPIFLRYITNTKNNDLV